MLTGTSSKGGENIVVDREISQSKEWERVIGKVSLW